MFRIAFASFVSAIALATALPAVAMEFPLAKGQVAVGATDTATTKANDTMLDMARQFDDGYVDFMTANPGINPWLPGDDKTVTVPNFFILPDAPRTGIVINLAERRIYYYPPGGKTVETYPAGVGVQADATPLGVTHVVLKEDGPVWRPPPSIRAERPELPAAIYPGPDDPLGAYALRLGWNNYLIHGTNKPDSVGRNVSHGCLHIYPEDIEHLFHEVPVGTQVRSVFQPVKAGWIDGRLYVEVHPSKEQADEIDYNQPMTPAEPQQLMPVVTKAAGDRADLVDWDAVHAAGLAASGIPTPVTPAAQDLQASDAPAPARNATLPAATNGLDPGYRPSAAAVDLDQGDLDPGYRPSAAATDSDTSNTTVIISGSGVTKAAPPMVPPVEGVSLRSHPTPQQAALQTEK
ncbi:MAG TPA: L,D-transpeptidase family protein [Stellaceae bacterium]|jgi:L,D-transpeptidase ErfK/SrfK|nr:L,D-transpeptidase family protein [Stellaceae bacterium]